MSRGIFGWSYPPGCNAVPGDEPEIQQPHCRKCGRFLSWTPDRTENWETVTECDGIDENGLSLCGFGRGNHSPHKVVWESGTNQFHKCNNCGTETQF